MTTSPTTQLYLVASGPGNLTKTFIFTPSTTRQKRGLMKVQSRPTQTAGSSMILTVIVELRHLGVQFHVTALGAQSTMQADVKFTDNSSQVTQIAYDRTGPAVFAAGVANGVLGVQLRNAANNSETLTGNQANNTVTITITSSSPTGRFDTSSNGSFSLTSLQQTINSGSPTNPNFPDFYYKDTAIGTVTLTAAVTIKGNNVTNLPFESSCGLNAAVSTGNNVSSKCRHGNILAARLLCRQR